MLQQQDAVEPFGQIDFFCAVPEDLYFRVESGRDIRRIAQNAANSRVKSSPEWSVFHIIRAGCVNHNMRNREFCGYAGIFPVRHFQCAGLIQIREGESHGVFANGKLFCQLFNGRQGFPAGITPLHDRRGNPLSDLFCF